MFRFVQYADFRRAFEELMSSDRCDVMLVRGFLESCGTWRGGPRLFTRLQEGSYHVVPITLPEEGDITVLYIFQEVVLRGGESWEDLISYLRHKMGS